MEYDVIVIGAGSAGAVVAARLSEDPDCAVLLLEAGPDYARAEDLPFDVSNAHEPSTLDHDWGYQAEALPGRAIALPRGKLTGGSSAINTGIAIRGTPGDFDGWAALGNDEWSWEACLPSFRKVEDDQDEGGDFHGKGGPIPVVRWAEAEMHPLQLAFRDACVQRGHPYVRDQNDPENTGVAPVAMNRRGRVRWSTALGYLGPARDRLNLTIRSGCLVDRILVEDGRAVGARVEVGGQWQTVRARRIVLSAGAIASPAILLRSGIGPQAELEALGIEPRLDLPGVGRQLMDHPMALIFCLAKEGMANAEDPLTQMLLRYTSDGGEYNDMQLYMLGHMNVNRPSFVETGRGAAAFALAPGVQLPRSIGSVTLASADPHEHPRIALNFTDNEEDLRRLREGLRLAWDIATSEPVASMHEGVFRLEQATMDDDEALNAFIRATATNMHHPTCTCRMGPDGDRGAVVDQLGRLRGLGGLYVADASIMPRIIRANTNLTCMVIGERVAGWMRAES